MREHTKGAIEAAEIITGGKYEEKETRYHTSYGEKTVEGIADIISRKTKVTELLIATKGALAALSQHKTYSADIFAAKVWLRCALDMPAASVEPS